MQMAELFKRNRMLPGGFMDGKKLSLQADNLELNNLKKFSKLRYLKGKSFALL
jgi:hypothetical protein